MRQADTYGALSPGCRPANHRLPPALAAPLHVDDPESVILDTAIKGNRGPQKNHAGRRWKCAPTTWTTSAAGIWTTAGTRRRHASRARFLMGAV